MNQSIEDVVRVFDEFKRGFASPDLILDAHSAEARNNAALLMEFVMKKYGWVTISYLQEADNALGAQLARVPPPKVKTAEELAAEEIAKQDRDYMDSIKPQESFDAKVARDKQKRQAAEAKKAQEDGKGQLAVAIAGYQCYRVNGAGIDYTATEMVQKELGTVVSRLPNGQRDYVRNLVVVRQIIQELPDHPKMGDVARVLEIVNARLHQPDKQSRDSFGEGVKKVGSGLR